MLILFQVGKDSAEVAIMRRRICDILLLQEEDGRFDASAARWVFDASGKIYLRSLDRLGAFELCLPQLSYMEAVDLQIPLGLALETTDIRVEHIPR